jgi:hypothetical protein
MSDENAGKVGGDDADGGAGKTRPRTWLDFAILALALSALLGLTALALGLTADDQDAVTILSVIVPAVVSIGGAAFGIPIAYGAGAARGKAEGEANKAQAVQGGKAAVAGKAKALVDEALAAQAVVVDRVTQVMQSVSGESDYSMTPGSAYEGAAVSLSSEEARTGERALLQLSTYLDDVVDAARE